MCSLLGQETKYFTRNSGDLVWVTVTQWLIQDTRRYNLFWDLRNERKSRVEGQKGGIFPFKKVG